MTAGRHRLFALAATVVVLGSVVWGFVIAGSPDTRRMERLDERRLDALQDIQREIQELVIDPNAEGPLVLWRTLPQTLEELSQRARDRKIEPEDPDTGEPYGYRVLSATTYELRATFSLPRDARRDVFWNHPAGEHAFTIDVLNPPR